MIDISFLVKLGLNSVIGKTLTFKAIPVVIDGESLTVSGQVSIQKATP